MSWWDTGNNDDVIGDRPADLVRHGLQEIVDLRTQQSRQKPMLAELLQAIGVVAIDAGRNLLEHANPNLREIVAELESGQTISSGLLRAGQEVNDLVPVLRENLRAIAEVYQERWERNPRLSEWLEAISFVIRARPEKFLHDGAAHPPGQLKAIPGDAAARSN